MKPLVQTLLNEQNESTYAHVPRDLLNIRAIVQKFRRQQNAQTIDDIDQTLSVYFDYCNALQTVHKFDPVIVDWAQVKRCKRPNQPQETDINEVKAKRRLANFKPTVYDKLFGTHQKEVSRLENYIEQARYKDVMLNQRNLQRYEEELSTWMELQQLCKGFEKGEQKAYKEVLHFFNPYSLVEALGVQIGFHLDGGNIDFDVYINPKTTIPNYEFNRMSTTALLKCKLSKKTFNTYLKNHISSVALKIARETYNLIPVDQLRINIYFKSVDETQQTTCEQIMSVLFAEEKFTQLDFENSNINDLLIEFRRELHFNTYQGFKPVLKVPFPMDLPNFMTRVN